MICPHCNEEIPDDSINFCSSCGKRLEPSPAEVIPSDTIVCPNCGAYNSKDSNFCSNCRTPLSQTALTNLKEQSELQLQQAQLKMQAMALKAQQEQLQLQQQQYSSMARCPRCGSTSYQEIKKALVLEKLLLAQH